MIKTKIDDLSCVDIRNRHKDYLMVVFVPMFNYHDKLIKRYKRNPIFRFWFWWELRKLK